MFFRSAFLLTKQFIITGFQPCTQTLTIPVHNPHNKMFLWLQNYLWYSNETLAQLTKFPNHRQNHSPLQLLRMR